MRRKDSRIERQFTHAAAVQRERRLLYRDAYGLTGLYGETFDNYSKACDGRGNSTDRPD